MKGVEDVVLRAGAADALLGEEGFDDPEAVIPAVKVSLVHFEHFVAQEQLVFEDLRLVEGSLKNETS